tara:strand:+ start:35 stop:814 length:780 start_codon:yes stop_codon:yes gene_type:complete
MTLQQIIAGLGAGQAVGMAEAGKDLTQESAAELFDIRGAGRAITEGGKEASDKDVRRKRRTGAGRVLGGFLGYLLGGPLGLAAGSLGGQGIAALTQRGGYELGEVSSGLDNENKLFYQGAREDVSAVERDTNRFIKSANDKYLTDIAVNTVRDYFLGSSLAESGITSKALTDIPAFAKSTDAEGNILGLLKGAKASFGADKSKRATEKLYGESLGGDLFDLLNISSAATTRGSFIPKFKNPFLNIDPREAELKLNSYRG